MSVAAQKIRHTHTQSSNWTLTFPKVQSTFQQSSLFMKKLLAVAISSITYLRAIFPEKAFGNRHLDNLNLKILSENSVCPEACQVIEWVKGSFEAIDKKYLRQMMFGIYTNPGEPDNVIEAYTFRIIYTREGTTVTCNGETVASTSPCSSDLTRKDTISLLRTILILTQSLDPLPRNAYMSMKLLYYDEVTPADYEPKGFVPAETDNFFFKNEPVNLRMGNVSTPYHCLKVRIKTDKKQFVIVEEEPIPSGSLPVEESSRSDKSESSEVKPNDQELNSSKIGDVSNAQELQNHPAYPENNQNEKNKNDKKVDVDDNIVKCPCGFLEDDGLMISCIKCETWQHATCFGILKENESPAKHICINCYVEDSQDFEPTDIHLYNLSPVDQQALCVWRRALMSCLDLKVVNATILARRLRIEKYVASSIMERLGREGYISNGTKKSHWKKNVNQEVIESTGISKYLRRETKDDITDNQIEELSKKTKNINIAGPTSYRFRGQKRAVSANSEEDQNFAFNSSQEVTADSIDGKRKRKKASTPETGIPVW